MDHVHADIEPSQRLTWRGCHVALMPRAMAKTALMSPNERRVPAGIRRPPRTSRRRLIGSIAPSMQCWPA